MLSSLLAKPSPMKTRFNRHLIVSQQHSCAFQLWGRGWGKYSFYFTKQYSWRHRCHTNPLLWGSQLEITVHHAGGSCLHHSYDEETESWMSAHSPSLSRLGPRPLGCYHFHSGWIFSFHYNLEAPSGNAGGLSPGDSRSSDVDNPYQIP